MLCITETCSQNLMKVLYVLTHGLETVTSLFTKLTITHGFFLIKNKIKHLQHVAKYSKNWRYSS